MSDKLKKFNINQINVIKNSVSAAEDLVSNHYKLSVNQWLGFRYDVKTLKDLLDCEIVHGPFAQVIKYTGYPVDKVLLSDSFDYYKICIQDHAVISLLRNDSTLDLYPFIIYVTVHELIHIVRFGKFLQFYNMDADKRENEEVRVHDLTSNIVSKTDIDGMSSVLDYHSGWFSDDS